MFYLTKKCEQTPKLFFEINPLIVLKGAELVKIILQSDLREGPWLQRSNLRRLKHSTNETPLSKVDICF